LNAKTLDVLIFISVIPAIPVIATWYLPWERWIPKKIPNSIIGPYLFYCSFAAWYFKGGWWVVGMLAIGGIVVSVMAGFELQKARNLRQAQDWPAVEGSIIHLSEQRDHNGLLIVTITYYYAVQDERYAGSESFKFRQDEEVARFKAAYSEGIIKVHYRPDRPEMSAPHLEQAR
jgi:hypothetical protein